MKRRFLLLVLAIAATLQGCVAQEIASFDPKTATVETCGAISTESVQGACYGAVAFRQKNASVCDEISWQYQRDVCYSGVAKGTKDARLCDRIQDASVKSLCRENFD